MLTPNVLAKMAEALGLKGKDAQQLDARVFPLNDKYAVTACGAVFSLRFGKVRRLSPATHHGNYPRVFLSSDGNVATWYVHRLVAITFLGPPPFPGALVRHLDGNPRNPHRDNLAWGTHYENAQDRRAHGRANTIPHLSSEQMGAVRAIKALGAPMSLVARAVGVPEGTLRRALIRDAGRQGREGQKGGGGPG